MKVLIGSSNVFVMSLLLFTMALFIGAVSNESVNRINSNSTNSSLSTLTQQRQVLPLHAVIDHSDLPTRFGDEDDVIEQKTDKKNFDGTTKTTGDKYDHRHSSSSNGGAVGYDSEEEYDEEDDNVGSEHSAPTSGVDRHLDNDGTDSNYDDESELGPTLDNFGVNGKFDGSENGSELPVFLLEPQSSYVVRNRPAILKCKAAHSLQVKIFFSFLSFQVSTGISLRLQMKT